MTTEVAGSPLEGHTVLSVRHYEAGPPANTTLDVVDPENTYATTKEEEWITKKKTELTTTRQIETRVKRQVVLEDGKVVGDSGPIVTTNTTEDTEKQEHKKTEHRTLGDDPPGPEWVAIPGPGGLVKEVKERKVTSREKREELVETEDVQHLGDITDEAYQSAVQKQQDVREVLLPENSASRELVSSTPKVIHQSTKSHKVVDTEDSQELSQLQEDGRLVTETRRTTEHEEVHDKEEPDEEKGGHSEEEETRKESSHRFSKTKDQDLVEYIADGVKIGEEMRFVAENVEGERHGDMTDQQDWDNLSTRIRRMRRQGAKPQHVRVIPSAGDPLSANPIPMDRKDALTKKPLDFDQEEETRKVETSKWLEHHFGSDSRSSKDSIDDEDAQPAGGSTSYINVTMMSRPINSNRTVTTRVVTPINSGTSPLPKAYTATVNTSSRVFVSSPEPEGDVAPASGFFQGVSDWSERRNDIKEGRTTFSPAAPQRPDRVQVLPVGPNHTFIPKSKGEISSPSPHSSSNHLDRTSPHQNTSNHHGNNRTAAYESNNFLSIERNATSHYKQHNGRRSPYHQKTSGRSSPFQNYNNSRQEMSRDSPPNGYPNRSSPFQNMDHVKSPTRSDYTYNGTAMSPPHDNDGYQSPQPPYRRRHIASEDEEHNYRHEKEGSYRRHEHNHGTEPPPDYSPPPLQNPNRTTPSPSPSPSPPLEQPQGTRGTPPPDTTSSNKKLYQRTRFAADIPPPPSRQRTKSPGQSATSIIGESFRKLVGKFRSSSSERKNKRRNKRSSRSPSPRHQHSSSTYQQYHVIDNNIPSVVGPGKSSRVGRRGGDSPVLPNEAERGGEAIRAEGGESNDMQPVAPPRSTRAVSQHYARAARRERSTQTGMEHYHRRGVSPVVQRFYLGEDPFGGSIYGREREYDGVTPVKSSRRHHKQNGHRRGSHPGEEEDMTRTNVSSNTLGRLSKSTSRLTGGGSDSPNLSRGAQTLPRKLYDERVKNQIYVQRSSGSSDPHHWESSRLNRINKSHQPHSNSMINVSIINNVTPPTSSIGINKPLTNGLGISSPTGPAKPARTYRSNLSRSKSFNVHAGGTDSTILMESRNRDSSNVYKSNPHLHRLDESPPPLKSPGILASISRSQRDLSESANFEKEETDYGRKQENNRFSKSTNNLISNGYGNNYINSTSTQEAKKKLFMKGLMDRAPELYKTLHGDEVPDIKTSSQNSVGRLYSSTPLKNGISSSTSPGRILDYSSSFRSSSTNATPENDSSRGGRPLSSPYRPSMILNGGDRVTSPKPCFTSTLTHTPSFRKGDGTATSVVRRGSIGKDDYSETVRITSKSDDPIRPSVTNTVQSYSKKTVPTKSGRSTETVESSETTTVTKSRLRGGDSSSHRVNSNQYSMRNGGAGGVVIEVRAPRK